MNKTRTRWFNIDRDGQPPMPGYWEVKYGTGDKMRFYWTGKEWRFSRRRGEIATCFGNQYTRGECWRGLVFNPSIKKAGNVKR